MSLIHTCELAGANPFHYLTELQRHAGGELAVNPSAWMPWNYLEQTPARPYSLVFRPASATLRKCPQNTGLRSLLPRRFLATPFGLACMLAFPLMTNRHCHCRSAPCASTSPSAAGPHRRANQRGRLRCVAPGTARATLLASARRREIDVVLVWRLDRWGRSVADLVSTLHELQHLGVGFVSLTEALDLTTPAGRAMAGLLAVFAEFEREILRERVRAGLDHARQHGKRLGRPPSVVHQAAEAHKLYRKGISKSEIARQLQIGRTSVRRLLAPRKS